MTMLTGHKLPSGTDLADMLGKCFKFQSTSVLVTDLTQAPPGSHLSIGA